MNAEDVPLPDGRKWVVLSPHDAVVSISSVLRDAKELAIERTDPSLPWESLESMGFRVAVMRSVAAKPE